MATQAADAPLTQSATFLVLSSTQEMDADRLIRRALSRLGDISKNVSSRHPHGNLSCVAGLGSEIWDRILNLPKPAELHPFPEVRGARHTAVSTPGDLFFHIRADRRDLCFEFERQLMELLGNSVKVEDETVGFRYFDARDLLGFVDGTANPEGSDAREAVAVTQDASPAAVGGSYVVVQKYLHDIKSWKQLSIEQQEAVIGRTKLDNIELDDAPDGEQLAHKSLATIEDNEGNEHEILRDNMPFGTPGTGTFDTYFIGYTKQLWVMEKMMERMFVGVPAGKHDKILDFSRAVTGTTFFAPSKSVLEGLDDD